MWTIDYTIGGRKPYKDKSLKIIIELFGDYVYLLIRRYII